MHLVDPGTGLTQMVLQEPKEHQDPEQVRQRRGVVGQVPAHGGGQVARLDLQPLGPLVLVDAPRLPSACSASIR
jgi:hypothetical protein